MSTLFKSLTSDQPSPQTISSNNAPAGNAAGTGSATPTPAAVPSAASPAAERAIVGEEDVVVEFIAVGTTRDIAFVDDDNQAPKTNTAPAARQSTVPVTVSTRPHGATLTVESDSTQTCQSPCIMNLALGKQVIHATLNGYRESLRTLTVEPKLGEQLIPMEQLTARVRVQTQQSTQKGLVRVRFKDKQSSYPMPANFALPAGTYDLRLLRKDQPAETGVLEVKDGESRRFIL